MIFILPTAGAQSYRGKYPNRARSVSASRHIGTYVELNSGVRLWTIRGALPSESRHDYAAELGAAVRMTDSDYGRLIESADLMNTIRGIAGNTKRDAIRAQVRRMREAIGAPQAAGEVRADPAPTMESAIASTIPGRPVAVAAQAQAAQVRRDNVEYHAGRAAWGANQTKDSNPYPVDGERAARWDLGWQEACDNGDPVKVSDIGAALERLDSILEGIPTMRALSALGSERATRGKREARALVASILETVRREAR